MWRPIINRGADWYQRDRHRKSRGTKVFALAGSVVNTGLIEVPMGLTLRQIVFDIGGGLPEGGTFKAVQTGGPSGGCIPEELLDMPVDYESLAEAGSIMGSGGMIVMDETTCMVDVAKFFMDFCREESCGKCLPCRVGHRADVPASSTGSPAGWPAVLTWPSSRAWPAWSRATSLCGLGQGAPNPVFSTLRYFRDEYLAHIDDRVCPAGVCKIEPRRKPAHARAPEPEVPMSEVSTLVIDGKDVAAPAGQSILSGRRENGVAIPTLCHLEGLSDVGACRLCMVEVEGTAKLLPACVTTVEEGMKVTTNSRAPGRLPPQASSSCSSSSATTSAPCAWPTTIASCRTRPGSSASPTSSCRRSTPNWPSTPPTSGSCMDQNRCILCTRCVRVCDEIEGAHTWDILGRGTEARLVSDLGTPWGSPTTCTSCGKCVQVCPTGALFEKGRSVAEAKSPPALPSRTWSGTGRAPRCTAKPRLATIWLDGCSGCHMSFLDMDERLLELAERADLVYGCLVDAKEFPEDVDVTLVEGAVSSEDDLRKIREVRQRHPYPGLPRATAPSPPMSPACATPSGRGRSLDRAYLENVTLHQQVPGRRCRALLPSPCPVHACVPVDVFIPGCPPSADRILDVILEPARRADTRRRRRVTVRMRS